MYRIISTYKRIRVDVFILSLTPSIRATYDMLTYKNFSIASGSRALKCYDVPARPNSVCVCFLLLGLCVRRENYGPTFFFGYSVVNFYTTLVECVSEKWTKERREGGVGNTREKADEKRKKGKLVGRQSPSSRFPSSPIPPLFSLNAPTSFSRLPLFFSIYSSFPC